MSETTIEGRQPVLEALKSGRDISKLYLAKGSLGDIIKEIESFAKKRKINIERVDNFALDKIAETEGHQGAVALGSFFVYAEVYDLLEGALKNNEDPFILALDQIQDPQNFGSILRTAEAMGVHGVIIPKKRSVQVTAAVGKASAGAVEYVPVARANIAQSFDYLKEQNCWVAGMDAEEGTSCFEADLLGPLVVAIGSEGSGLRRLVKDKCDFFVRIPMSGRINSLNAANAASILMYEVVRQRRRREKAGNEG